MKPSDLYHLRLFFYQRKKKHNPIHDISWDLMPFKKVRTNYLQCPLRCPQTLKTFNIIMSNKLNKLAHFQMLTRTRSVNEPNWVERHFIDIDFIFKLVCSNLVYYRVIYFKLSSTAFTYSSLVSTNVIKLVLGCLSQTKLSWTIWWFQSV